MGRYRRFLCVAYNRTLLRMGLLVPKKGRFCILWRLSLRFCRIPDAALFVHFYLRYCNIRWTLSAVTVFDNAVEIADDTK